jgi:hypothetical protein
MDVLRGNEGLKQGLKRKRDTEEYVQVQQREKNPQKPQLCTLQERFRRYCQSDPKRVPLLQRRV